MALALNSLKRVDMPLNKETKPNQTNTGGLCCFRYERFINILTSVHDDTRRVAQFLKAYANHTMLTPPQRAVHLVMFKISDGRDLQNFNYMPQLFAPMAETQLSACMVQSQLTLFQNPQILRTISSGHDVIHTPVPFPIWGLLWL